MIPCPDPKPPDPRQTGCLAQFRGAAAALEGLRFAAKSFREHQERPTEREEWIHPPQAAPCPPSRSRKERDPEAERTQVRSCKLHAQAGKLAKPSINWGEKTVPISKGLALWVSETVVKWQLRPRLCVSCSCSLGFSSGPWGSKAHAPVPPPGDPQSEWS